jgi:hypothetical protein
MNDVKAHPWFRGLDWDMLEAKELSPIFQPDVSITLNGFGSWTDPLAAKESQL